MLDGTPTLIVYVINLIKKEIRKTYSFDQLVMFNYVSVGCLMR